MTLRSLRHLALAALLAVPAVACSSAPEEDAAPVEADENEIVNVAQTDVERQSIGNCWLYAHASWVESMNMTATGEDFDISQSYWTYWHWFDQIAGGFTDDDLDRRRLGGRQQHRQEVRRHDRGGLRRGGHRERDVGRARRRALDAINASLKSGALADPAARRDKKRAARGDGPRVGPHRPRPPRSSPTCSARPSRAPSPRAPRPRAGTAIVRPQDFAVSYTSAPGRAAGEEEPARRADRVAPGLVLRRRPRIPPARPEGAAHGAARHHHLVRRLQRDGEPRGRAPRLVQPDDAERLRPGPPGRPHDRARGLRGEARRRHACSRPA